MPRSPIVAFVGRRDQPQNEGSPRIRTRRGAIAAIILLQAAVCLAGWFFAFARVRVAAAGDLDRAPIGVATLVAGCVALSVLGLTGLATFWVMRRYEFALERINRGLESEVERRTHQNLAARDAIIMGLARLADCRDSETGLHLERISAYSALLARKLAETHPEIDEPWIERIRLASSMHDIGKVGLPDEILLKPGRLTESERRRMQAHTTIGADTLLAIRARLGDDDLLDMSICIALEHHERWDGSGYPLRVAAERISLPARIVALADVYDAMTSRRVYKLPLTHVEAREIIIEGRAAHFDPEVVDAFRAIEREFDDIRQRMHADEPAQLARAA